MAASLDTSLSLHPFRPRLSYRSTVFPITNPAFLRHRRFKLSGARSLVNRHFVVTPISVDSHCTTSDEPLNVYETLVRLTASALLFLGLGVRVCLAAPTRHPPVPAGDEQTLQEELNIQGLAEYNHRPFSDTENVEGKFNNVQNIEDGKMDAAFETWKSKTFALSVPLRVVVLNASIPPSWLKEFLQSQGRRLRFSSKYAASLENIFNDLSISCNKGNFGPKSTMAADIVSVGDSWLNFAIKGRMIEPINGVEDQDWYTGLSDKWKAYLRRNCEGGIDPKGEIWAAPYRWGTMVIAYKKSKFKQYKIAPIEDWADLWRPELAGKISMVDSPREVVGAVLKYMGASYNTKNIDTQVAGGKSAVQKNLALLGKQVRLFDSMQYIKAFGVGDVWVAVGWSSDILPAAKRMSNIAVVVPRSGASLWADLWAVPAASRFKTNQIGGRVRGPSPLIHQWIEFCLQPARALPFKQEVIAGAVPSALENAPAKLPEELTKGKPRLDTNLVAGVPPPDILARCEFLEPLPDGVVSDYKWLISSMQKPAPGSTHWIHQYISSMIQTFWARGADKSNMN